MLNVVYFRFVPMNRKFFFGLTLTAVLAMAVAFPAVADAITSIENTQVKQNALLMFIR